MRLLTLRDSINRAVFAETADNCLHPATVMVTWLSTVQTGLPWVSGTSLAGTVPRGNTLLRIHFGWGFIGSTSPLASTFTTQENAQVFGLVTKSGTGTETAPNPRTSPGNPSPPLERWLWWEARVPQISAYSIPGGVIMWHDSDRPQANDAHGQVAATMAAPNNLDVWASWAAGGSWESSGHAEVWYWARIAYQPSV